MKISYLWKGLPGHPIHPPLTDATIGAYTASTVMAVASVIGVAHVAAAYGWWLALVVGLIVTAFTALTGFADWLTIEWGSPLWKTATWHMVSMLTATVFFLVAALAGHSGYRHGAVETGPFILTLAGFLFLTVGGWLGGAVVFVHGMRVLSLVDEPTDRAVSPIPHPEKEEAEA
ncbi:MAG: DUF2231 domain-containing protein [Gaiellaceae bacterium]